MRTVPSVFPSEMLDEDFLKPQCLAKYRLAKYTDRRKCGIYQDACAFNHSRKALFNRVCQPEPVLLKNFTMSASNRMFTCSLGSAMGGRPRLGVNNSFAAASPNNAGSTSLAGRALSNHSSVASGTSSSIDSGLGLCGISAPFPLVRAAQADHVHRTVSRRENEHVQPIGDQAQGLVSAFRISLARVLGNQHGIPVEFLGQVEGKAAIRDVALDSTAAVPLETLASPIRSGRPSAAPGAHLKEKR